MHIIIKRQLEDLDSIREDWCRLFDDGKRYSIFEHFDWVYESYKNIYKGDILLLLIRNDKHELLGIFPFTISTFKIKALSFRALMHASGDHADYSSFILARNINKKVAIKRIIEKLRELQPGLWDIYDINGLNDEDDTARLFRLLLLRSIYGKDLPAAKVLRINYSNPYGEAKKISNVNRRFSKLTKERDSVSLNIGKEINSDILNIIRNLHNDQFNSAGFSAQSSRQYFDDLLGNASFKGHVEVSYITIDGEVIAGHFGFNDGDRLYYYVPVYKKKYEKYGPGQYLLMNMIDHYKSQGLKEFDFLRGDDSYKFDWANTSCTNYRIVGCPADSGFFMKALINLWILTRTLPVFSAGDSH